MMTFVQMKLANQRAGRHWFDKGSMNFFQTKLIGNPDAFNLFVTSEVDPSDKMRYTVRQFVEHSAEVFTVGEFHKMTKEEAQELKTSIAKALRTMGAREQAIFDKLTWVGKSDLGPDCIEFISGDKSFVVRDGKIVN